MIITILPTSTTFHAVSYNEKKVEKGQAFLLEAQNISLRPEAFNPERLTQYFEDYSARNTRIQNAQFHVAISCKGDEYTHEQLLEIAHRYLKEMGYDEEGQPLLVYAHHDTPNNHIHVVTSRIAPDGHRISDKFEKKRSREITERIMAEYTDNNSVRIFRRLSMRLLAIDIPPSLSSLPSSKVRASTARTMMMHPLSTFIEMVRNWARFRPSSSCSMP